MAPETKPQDPLFFDDLRDKNAKSVATNREIREEIRDIETVETEEIEIERLKTQMKLRPKNFFNKYI